MKKKTANMLSRLNLPDSGIVWLCLLARPFRVHSGSRPFHKNVVL